MKELPAVLLGVVALIVLTISCVGLHRDSIEVDLTRRASAALDAAGFDTLVVSAEGRDLTLSGAGDLDLDVARAAASVVGVRVVRFAPASTDGAASAAPSAPATSELGLDDAPTTWHLTGRRDADGGFRWRGALAAVSADALAAASPRWLGDAIVSDVATTLDDGSPAGAFGRAENLILGALPLLGAIDGASIEASPAGVTLSGRPASLVEAIGARSTLEGLADGLAVDVRWDRTWSEADLRLEATAGADGWRLAGLVPDGDRATWLAAMNAAGLEPVTDHLLETELTAPADFGVGFAAGLDALGAAGGDLTGARLTESPGTVRLVALADDPTLEARIRQALADHADADRLALSMVRRLDGTSCQADLGTALANESIQFDSGSAAIGPESAPLLSGLATTLNRCPSFRVTVEGHTDSDGDDAFNEVLSLRRADAVTRRLAALGVDTVRLTAIGFGETRPLVAETDAAAKRQNRRIEIILHEEP